MDRRAKLLGLDAPEQKKVETSFSIAWLDDDEEPTTIDAPAIKEIQNGKKSTENG